MNDVRTTEWYGIEHEQPDGSWWYSGAPFDTPAEAIMQMRTSDARHRKRLIKLTLQVEIMADKRNT